MKRFSVSSLAVSVYSVHLHVLQEPHFEVGAGQKSLPSLPHQHGASLPSSVQPKGCDAPTLLLDSAEQLGCLGEAPVDDSLVPGLLEALDEGDPEEILGPKFEELLHAGLEVLATVSVLAQLLEALLHYEMVTPLLHPEP